MKAKEIRIYSLLLIDTFFFFLEIIIGYAVNSLALIADSFHMLNDIFSLFVALWAVRVAKNNKADAKYTYGWKRAEILGALINAVFLLALCFSILIEAIQRLINPQIITNPKLILYVGTAGLISNIVGLFLFHEHGHSHGGSGGHSHASELLDEESSINAVLPETVVNEHSSLLNGGHGHDHAHSHSTYQADDIEEAGNDHSHAKLTKQKAKSMNMQGVFLHVVGDALGNIGVMMTAIFIWKTDYSWKFYADPMISLVITAIIFSSALPLCRRSSKILLQATPSDISADSVQDDILKVNGVVSVHDFHIWNLTEDIFIASLHIEVDASPAKFLQIAKEIRSTLHEYGIHSATVQPEFIGNVVSQEDRDQFKRLAGGRSTASLRDGATTPYGTHAGDQCQVDSATNCNTENCLD